MLLVLNLTVKCTTVYCYILWAGEVFPLAPLLYRLLYCLMAADTACMFITEHLIGPRDLSYMCRAALASLPSCGPVTSLTYTYTVVFYMASLTASLYLALNAPVYHYPIVLVRMFFQLTYLVLALLSSEFVAASLDDLTAQVNTGRVTKIDLIKMNNKLTAVAELTKKVSCSFGVCLGVVFASTLTTLLGGLTDVVRPILQGESVTLATVRETYLWSYPAYMLLLTCIKSHQTYLKVREL